MDEPILAYFYSPSCGPSRAAERFLAGVLQRRQNHCTFRQKRVDIEARPDLATRFGVSVTPTIIVIDGRRVAARVERPRGMRQIHAALSPWLR